MGGSRRRVNESQDGNSAFLPRLGNDFLNDRAPILSVKDDSASLNSSLPELHNQQVFDSPIDPRLEDDGDSEYTEERVDAHGAVVNNSEADCNEDTNGSEV